jgi:hypothetical protein
MICPVLHPTKRTHTLDANDAELIANAPTDLRALLDEVERLKAWQVAVADGLGYLNSAEGQGGYEVAEPETVIGAWSEQEREVERLKNDLAMARQVSGELCEACGWAMKFPGEPCRCALLDEVERLKSDPLPAAAWVREVERAAYRRGAQEASERAKAEVERLTNALAAHRDEVPAQDSAKDVVEWQMTNSPVGTTHAYLDGVDLRVRWDGQDAAWDATRYGRCATEAEARRAATAAARGMK